TRFSRDWSSDVCSSDLSYFNPHLSWVVPASRNDYLLKHEQLHFDITELHARKLRRELANISVEKLGKNAKEVLNAYYEKMEKQRSEERRVGKECRSRV